MDEIALILFVQQYEDLYNLQHPHYMNRQRRDNIWEEIGERMNETGTVCRERWSRIRENYRKALSLRKTKSGQAASKIKPPKYNKELSFLTSYINDEEHRLSNISLPEREIVRETSSSHVLYSQVDSPGDDSQHSESPLPRYTPTRPYSRTSSHKSTDNPTTSVAAVLKEYLAKQKDVPHNSAQNNINVHQDPLIEFFMSMARTVQRFDKKKQLHIKGKLFQLVHNAELEMLNEKDAPSVPIGTVHSPELTHFTLPLNPIQNTTTFQSIAIPHFTIAEERSAHKISYIAPTTSTVISGVTRFTNEEKYCPDHIVCIWRV
ncbi:unnamed protein product [Parnassius mnemosyne]|uniref:MADF domain-containing protein n=1 Tax=Parnassius mnemosyne TaxID=213953 RepID=A0AAV1L7R7_9NEOP